MSTILDHQPPVHHQFDDAEQQHEAATLGMWTFLATEVLFFGGLFLSYTVYRHLYPHAWEVGSSHLKFWLGATNTAILLTSSFTVALAVHFAKAHQKTPTAIVLALTIVFGIAFLCIKGTEYKLEYDEHLVPAVNFHYDDPPSAMVPDTQPLAPDVMHIELFITFYFLMTLLHAMHMIIGISLLTFLLIQVLRNRYVQRGEDSNPIEIIGLYWHFVDIVWLFLFPLLYMVK